MESLQKTPTTPVLMPLLRLQQKAKIILLPASTSTSQQESIVPDQNKPDLKMPQQPCGYMPVKRHEHF